MTDARPLFEAYASDPAATRFLSWPARRHVDEVRDWLEPRVAAWEEGDEYRWVIVDHPAGDAFGTAVLRRGEDAYDLGYALARRRAGRGVATQVVRRLVALCAETGLTPTLRARTDPDNRASIRVLEKAGFEIVAREPPSAVRPALGVERPDTLVYRRATGSGGGRESNPPEGSAPSRRC